MGYGNYGTQTGGINYGIGGNYLSGLQTGLDPVMTPTVTPFPPDSYTPAIFGSQPPAYTTPPPGGGYQVPPQPSYYQGPVVQQQPYTYQTGTAALTSADASLDKERQEAINQGRPDLLAQINSRENTVNAAQGQLQAYKPANS